MQLLSAAAAPQPAVQAAPFASSSQSQLWLASRHDVPLTCYSEHCALRALKSAFNTMPLEHHCKRK